jgi:hypothetical protein
MCGGLRDRPSGHMTFRGSGIGGLGVPASERPGFQTSGFSGFGVSRGAPSSGWAAAAKGEGRVIRAAGGRITPRRQSFRANGNEAVGSWRAGLRAAGAEGQACFLVRSTFRGGTQALEGRGAPSAARRRVHGLRRPRGSRRRTAQGSRARRRAGGLPPAPAGLRGTPSLADMEGRRRRPRPRERSAVFIGTAEGPGRTMARLVRRPAVPAWPGGAGSRGSFISYAVLELRLGLFNA